MTQWQTQIDELRKDHRVPLLLAGLCALLLLWSASDLVGTLATHHLAINTAKVKSTPKQLYHLADLHLLGVYPANLSDLPTTQLPFTLEGTIIAVDAPTQSRVNCIIEKRHGSVSSR
jgi:hypothetical protein